MKRRTDSASRRSWSAVEPIRSANTIVTVLRAAVFSAAAAGEAASGAPHSPQNFMPGVDSVPHAGQRAASGCPQPPQKRWPGGFASPQLVQFTASFRAQLGEARERIVGGFGGEDLVAADQIALVDRECD